MFTSKIRSKWITTASSDAESEAFKAASEAFKAGAKLFDAASDDFDELTQTKIETDKVVVNVTDTRVDIKGEVTEVRVNGKVYVAAGG